MSALTEHLQLSLRLHFRNKMALLYGYLFPLIFLVAFWVLYRHEKVPLLRHMGELLTVAVLGGACFGLPTTLVSERERGVWRRYRLTPVPTWVIVTSTVLARYVIVLTAGLLQLGLALAIGMTMPAHPFDLWVAFTFVSFAFIGLGLVIATLADNVPAVQALGQCIFLPMLIIGGVAVQLASLPLWAQHVSAYFPGRYAVEALQACVTGRGLPGARFSLLALGLVGFAGCLAGAKMFRWDAQQKFATRTGKLWLVPALAAWVAVGLLAEWRGRIAVPVDKELPAA
ncbi:MAG: ABC transporter permease, partial [Opitutaceae bacterium]|nr:ABC transporter permease [Opitutaceae bacterium]